MSIFQAVILGVIQGLTEFLPVSSSGHLILLPEVFGWEQHNLAFDTILHFGTALALVFYFWKDLWEICRAFVLDLASKKTKVSQFSDFGKLGMFVIVGSIPAGILGFFLEDYIESNLRNVSSVVAFLIFGSVLMFIAEKFSKVSPRILTIKKSFIIGLFQALALFPGVSRSGSTISVGMLFGLTREEAARFSFLLSVPIVVGAAFYKISSSINSALILDTATFVGFASSFLVGLIAIKFLLGFLKKNTLYWFVGYRMMLALGLILTVIRYKVA